MSGLEKAINSFGNTNDSVGQVMAVKFAAINWVKFYAKFWDNF